MLPIGALCVSYSWRGATHIIKKACGKGRLRGDTLPWVTKHQTILRYVDDSLVMVRGDEQYVGKLVRSLVVFSEASIMEINWEQSCT